MDPKTAGLLGLCRRAGKISVGFDAVCADVRHGRAALVLRAADLSAKTEKELLFTVRRCIVNRPPLCRLDVGKAELARLIGVPKPVGVCCVTDKGFAAALQRAGLQPEACDTEEDMHL